MTEAEWALALRVFEAARELAAGERRHFVETYDAPVAVRAQVLELLAGDEPETVEEGPAPGRTYGRYTLVESLGQGGMGVVYSARDNELGRLVALKFVSTKARRVGVAVDRLVYEAQAASALNHPNLVTVYEVLRSEAGVALVTELVEGRSLRESCGQPHALPQIAVWCAQIARGLAASHASGIIHGDIKPENVMVRPDGYIKILDFGLAQKDGAQPEWDSVPLGSLGYMSPEQTRGARLTPATDVFSLGVVLLELAAGRHPFLEASISATTRAINERAVVVPETAKNADRRLAPLLQAMLDKDAAKRPGAAEVADRLEAMASGSRPNRASPWMAVAAAVLAVATGAWFWMGSGPAPRLTAEAAVPVTNYAGVESQPALSPDGTQVAFVWTGLDDANQSIYVKHVDGEDPRRLTTDSREHGTPAWSPDGKWIAYVRRADDGGDADVLLRPAAGGEERRVGHVVDHQGYRGLAWWPDSGSLVTRDAGPEGRPLVRLFLDGSKRVLTSAPDAHDSRPAISADGQWLAFLRTGRGEAAICRMRLTGGREACSPIEEAVSSLAWFGDGKLLFSGEGGITLLGENGERTPLLEGGMNELDVVGKRAVFGRSSRDTNIWRLDVASGKASKFLASSGEDSEPEYAPDGKSILFRSNRSGRYDLYQGDSQGQGVRQLTRLKAHVGSGRWSPDGRWIAFDGFGVRLPGETKKTRYTNIYVIPAEGGVPRRLTDDTRERLVPGWSRDGRWVYYTEEPGSLRETWKIPVEGGTAVRVSASEMFDILESGDGNWLYYSRPRDRAFGIWRSPVAGGAAQRVAGTENLRYRFWDLRGNNLFFLASGADAAFVKLGLSGGITKLGPAPKSVFNGPRGAAASPDGKTVLYTQLDLTVGDLFRVDLGEVGR